MQYLDAVSKMTEWSVRFQGKPFNITVIQVYAPTTNALEAEVGWFYEDLQDPELTPETMKGQSQSKNNAQLWMCLVIEAKSNAVKRTIA